jgi:hypothetical protein
MHRFLAILMLMTAASAPAQWVHYSTAGIPRTKDGKPNLSAPAPRTPDGKPDFSGIWQLNRREGRLHGSLAADLKDVPFQPSAEKLYKHHLENSGATDPVARCLPFGVPRVHVTFEPYQIVQRTDRLIVLHENLTMYRQVFTDGRELPKDPTPTWMGYSVGHWEGDALVVNSAGFNGKAWLDTNGHPTSDALQVTERFRRRDLGHMEIQITVDDPKMYTRPWTVTVPHELLPDSELMEFVCLENEKSLSHYAETAGSRP